MVDFRVFFNSTSAPVSVPSGSLLSDAARLAGIEINQPCGGQGRCGRCLVEVVEGSVRRRSTLRLSQADLEIGYALACQTVVESDVRIHVPPQEKIERRLTTDLTVVDVTVPESYPFDIFQPIRRIPLTLIRPSMDDQTDDLSRLLTALRQQAGLDQVQVPLPLLRRLGKILRERDWQVSAVLEVQENEDGNKGISSLIDLIPGIDHDLDPIWGAAIDIGTTTVTLWLVDLVSGEVKAQVSEYNGQIVRGEDVISRIVYASKNGAGEEIRLLVVKTINGLLNTACKRIKSDPPVQPSQVVKAVVSGNSTMIHLFLGVPADGIRLSPFITVANQFPPLKGAETGIDIHPLGIVDCLPGVASYVGSDISAGVYVSGLNDSPQTTLFMDVGTNGEIVLGSKEWLVTCACSAGPAFEGAGVTDGMRATNGAIEEVWINNINLEPSCRVIGGEKPAGICGSGLISLLAEMFMTGVVDKAGNLNPHSGSERIREGERGLEYVIAWGNETRSGKDITITHVDVDNLLRAKGAIFAGYTVLAESVGVPMEMIDKMLIGGSFGKYINVEKAIQIGLLPDLPWDHFEFLGNTSVKGAYYALLDRSARRQIQEIASKMTYIELSADNKFYEAFMSALFLPHTDLSKFPSVVEALES